MINEQPTKHSIATTFGRKAAQYHIYAKIQLKAVQQLLLWIVEQNQSGNWADLGCGPGTVIKELGIHSNKIKLFNLDIAFDSLKQVLEYSSPISGGCINADIDRLPFKKSCFDGVILASVLQWTHSPQETVETVAQSLKKNGVLFYAVFVENSFNELYATRRAFNLTIPTFIPSIIEFNDWLKKSGLTTTHQTQITEKECFESSLAILKSLRSIGGTAVTGKRLSPTDLKKFCAKYEEQFKTESGIPITYSLLLGTAVNV